MQSGVWNNEVREFGSTRFLPQSVVLELHLKLVDQLWPYCIKGLSVAPSFNERDVMVLLFRHLPPDAYNKSKEDFAGRILPA
jgi:hypothetical protein